MQAGIVMRGAGVSRGHGFVRAQFAGQLIRRRKLYASRLADVLIRLMALRETADYKATTVSAEQALRAVRRATDFVQAVQEQVKGHES